MCFGETQRCRRPAMQEAVTGRQTGDHLGNISMSVWNCRAPAGGPGVCEGEAGGGERNPTPPLLMEAPGPRLLWLFLCWEVSAVRCVCEENVRGKGILITIFFLINHNFLKEHLHIVTHENRRV